MVRSTPLIKKLKILRWLKILVIKIELVYKHHYTICILIHNCLVSLAGGRLAESIYLESEMLVVKIVKRTA